MYFWHHWLNGHELEQTLGDSGGQGSLVYCHPWGHKELDMTEQLTLSFSKRVDNEGLTVGFALSPTWAQRGPRLYVYHNVSHLHTFIRQSEQSWKGTSWYKCRDPAHSCCSVTKLCLTLCDFMDCSTPGFPVLHCLPEFAQILVHWVGDAIQPSHPLSSLLLLSSVFPSIRVFSNESALHIKSPKC